MGVKQDKDTNTELKDKLQEFYTRGQRIQNLRDILPYAKESLNSKEPISDQLKESIEKYDRYASKSFQEQFGQSIMEDKKRFLKPRKKYLRMN